MYGIDLWKLSVKEINKVASQRKQKYKQKKQVVKKKIKKDKKPRKSKKKNGTIFTFYLQLLSTENFFL